jgi:hypothetical protein
LIIINITIEQKQNCTYLGVTFIQKLTWEDTLAVEYWWLASTKGGCEISSSHSGEYDVQTCLLGCTAV